MASKHPSKNLRQALLTGKLNKKMEEAEADTPPSSPPSSPPPPPSKKMKKATSMTAICNTIIDAKKKELNWEDQDDNCQTDLIAGKTSRRPLLREGKYSCSANKRLYIAVATKKWNGGLYSAVSFGRKDALHDWTLNRDNVVGLRNSLRTLMNRSGMRQLPAYTSKKNVPFYYIDWDSVELLDGKDLLLKCIPDPRTHNGSKILLQRINSDTGNVGVTSFTFPVEFVPSVFNALNRLMDDNENQFAEEVEEEEANEWDSN
jgi:hypothetical protein